MIDLYWKIYTIFLKRVERGQFHSKHTAALYPIRMGDGYSAALLRDKTSLAVFSLMYIVAVAPHAAEHQQLLRTAGGQRRGPVPRVVRCAAHL